MLLYAAILAFSLAFAIAALELATSKFPQTIPFLGNCPWFWAYSLIYGFIAFGVALALDALVAAKAINMEGLGVQNPWLRALIIGLSAKALVHIRWVNVTVGTQQFPIGTETIVMLFEPWLLRAIDLHEFNGVRDFVSRRAEKYPDADLVKQSIKGNIPDHFISQAEREAILIDIDKESEVVGLMEYYLRHFGMRSFDRVFPRRANRRA